MPALSDALVAQFIADGFVRIDNAFPAALAAEARKILWADTGVDPNDPATWTKPVIRLGNYGQQPFRDAANTPFLHAAFDQLVGQNRWVPQNTLGTFPIRFPSPDDPGDAGWHVDVSFGWEENPTDFLSWRANITSKGRALLMLFLFSEVGEKDAPTRIRSGSHLTIARRLAPAGDAGLTLRELASTNFAESADCPEILATGSPAPSTYATPSWSTPPNPTTGQSPASWPNPHCCREVSCSWSDKTEHIRQWNRQYAGLWSRL